MNNSQQKSIVASRLRQKKTLALYYTSPPQPTNPYIPLQFSAQIFAMVRLSLAASLLAALVSQSSAHFLLNYPPTIGFQDDLEETAPCGSFTVDFSNDNLTDFYVGGSEVAVTTVHPQANWLFRATLGSNQHTNNWTQLMPIIQQTGLGIFCEPAVTVPPSWAGQQGILSIVQDGPDGILYQVSLNQ